MKKRYMFITALLVVAVPALIMVSPATAMRGHGCLHHGKFHGGPGAMPFRGPIPRVLHAMEDLELTREQRDKVWDILDEIRPQIRAAMEALLDGRKQMRDLMGGGYDEAHLRKLADAQGDAIADLVMIRSRTRHRLLSVLTPEQEAELGKLQDPQHERVLGP